MSLPSVPTGPLDCLVLGEGPQAVLVHGTGGLREQTWSHQLELAARYRLILPDRGGYGRSRPGTSPSFEGDGEDIAETLGAGAHLVGFSYGAIGSLIAAALRPEAVHSLTVIEPPAFGLARGRPEVEALIEGLKPVFAVADSLTAAEYDARFDRALGFDHVPTELTPDGASRLDSARRERRPWEAQPDLDRLRAAVFPKLVFRGDWNRGFGRVAEVIARAIGAELVTIPGGHAVQHRPGFNQRLEELWAAAPAAGS